MLHWWRGRGGWRDATLVERKGRLACCYTGGEEGEAGGESTGTLWATHSLGSRGHGDPCLLTTSHAARVVCRLTAGRPPGAASRREEGGGRRESQLCGRELRERLTGFDKL